MPRTARRPMPITLPHYPMDTLWEVDESLEQAPSQSKRSQPLRSVFEDDDEEEMQNVAFPLPPRSLPPMKRFFSKMSLPIHSPPRTRSSSRSPPKPTRALPPIPRPVSPAVLAARPVSPSSSASSSDTEPPRTPPAASSPLPAYVLAPPPPAEWESAIDALFDLDDEEEEAVSSKWSSSSSTPRASPIPIIRPTDSYLSFSPPCSPPRISFMQSAKSPLPPSMSVYTSDSLPMSPTFSRPLGSPGLMPTSPTSPAQWSVPSRPPRSTRRMGTITVRIES